MPAMLSIGHELSSIKGGETFRLRMHEEIAAILLGSFPSIYLSIYLSRLPSRPFNFVSRLLSSLSPLLFFLSFFLFIRKPNRTGCDSKRSPSLSSSSSSTGHDNFF